MLQRKFPLETYPTNSPYDYNVLIPEEGYTNVYKITIKFYTRSSNPSTVYNLYTKVCHEPPGNCYIN